MSRHASRLTCLVLALVAVTSGAGLVPAGAAAAEGSIGVRLVDVPVTARDDPRARLYVVDHLAPGSSVHRRIEVSNTTGSPAHVALYPAAAGISDGTFVGAAGHTRNEVSSWTSVSPAALDAPAGGRVTADVAIVVPRDAAAGERYGVVWAEVRSAPAGRGGITQVNRVGIRLYLSVGPGAAPAADFAIDLLTASRSPGGRPVVVATVRNTGGRALDLNGSLLLSAGPAGLRAGPFPARLGVTLAVGATEPVTVELGAQLPAGPWDARITLRSGLLERVVQGTITFPTTGSAPPVRTTAPRPGRARPVTAAVLLLGVAALAFALAGRRHRLERSDPAAPR